MSSLLQSLFHTRLFRACVYHTPVTIAAAPVGAAAAAGAADAADVATSGAAASPPLPDVPRIAKQSKIIHALQRVFLALEGSGSRYAGVSTRPLTDSFNWHNGEELQQHDVQELIRILLDHLEKKMAGTPLAKVCRGRELARA